MLDEVIREMSAEGEEKDACERLTKGETARQRALRQALRNGHMSPISRIARRTFGVPGMDVKFKLPAKRADNEAILDSARGMAQAAGQHAEVFVKQEGLPPDFLEQFMIAIRGVVAGADYWPGPDDLWQAVRMTRGDALGRYDAVIHLRVPDEGRGYGHQNPLRLESAADARAIDERILRAWEGHPNRHIIESPDDFLAKTEQALAVLRDELPICCRDHTAHALTRALRDSHVRSA